MMGPQNDPILGAQNNRLVSWSSGGTMGVSNERLNETKGHTPGPWNWIPRGANGRLCRIYCEVRIDYELATVRNEADARLIALAPEILSELRALRARYKHKEIVDAVIRGVCELPDYNSPDDQPDLLMCTVSELELVVRRALGEDP